MLLERLSVLDYRNVLCDFRRGFLETVDFALRFGHGVVRPEGAAAGHVAPFTRHVVFLHVGAYGGDVFQFEFGDGGGAVKEEGLAVASILSNILAKGARNLLSL